TQIGYIKSLTGDDFMIYSGNDNDTLPMLTLGASGVISVVSHIAGLQVQQMMDLFWKGEIEKSRDLHLQLLPLVDALFPPSLPSPAPVKAALQLQGFDCGNLRLPLIAANSDERENIRKAMGNFGLKI